MSKRKKGREAAPGDPRKVRFDRDTIIWDALEAHAGVEQVLLEYGLPCRRCVVADTETLADGCTPLGLAVDEIVARLNALD